MPDTWQIVATIGAIATPIVVAVIGIVGARRIEALRIELQRSNNSHAEALERLRDRLSVESARKNRLLVKAAGAIEATYIDLLKFRDAVALYMSPVAVVTGVDKKERERRFLVAGRTFEDRFRAGRIYLPKRLTTKISALHLRLEQFVFRVHYTSKSTELAELEQRERAEFDTFLRDEAPKLLEDLETEFRKLLGHDDGARGGK